MLRDFETILSFNSTPGNGCTRVSFSDEDKKARDYLLSQMEQLGLSIKVDAIGNIRAKYGEHLDGPSIMIGSHIDTVKHGGKYDGLTGVLAALEIIRVLKEEAVPLRRPIELISFSEEEGSNFGITMLGSKAATGHYSTDELKMIHNSEGVSVYDKAKQFGLAVENLADDVFNPGEIDTMIEMHIEQGAVLEKNHKSIGIVEAIAGMNTYKVTLEGDSNHAGTTPMELRSDPMVGAAIVIAELQKTAKEKALPTTVATVGKIACEPNVPNIIPQKVEFFVDIRDVDSKGVQMVSQKLEELIHLVATEHFLRANIELVGSSETVNLSPRIIDEIEKVASQQNFKYMKLNSGAVHDVAMLGSVTDIGMIFIPSVGGKSHCPEEHTNQQDIKAGCDLLLNAVKALASTEREAQKI